MRYSDIIKEIKEPRQLFLKVLHRYPETFKWMDDETYLKFVYRIALGKKLNLNNPKTFNEKLQWLKLHDRKDVYTTNVGMICSSPIRSATYFFASYLSTIVV